MPAAVFVVRATVSDPAKREVLVLAEELVPA
jgi:hypothetical protein